MLQVQESSRMKSGRNNPGVNRHRIEELKGTVMVPVSGPTGASDWVSPIRKVTGSEQSMRPFPLTSVHPSNVMAKLFSPQTGKGRSRQRHRNVFRILKGSFSFSLTVLRDPPARRRRAACPPVLG